MLNQKNFQIIESGNIVYALRVTGKRYRVLVRSGNVIFKGLDGNIFRNASVPDMDLNVIETEEDSFIVNVTSYEGRDLGKESIIARLNYLTEKNLELLKMKIVQFYPFREVYPHVVDEVVYRHIVDDTFQGILTKTDIHQYRQYVISVLIMEEVKKQKIEFSQIEAETVLITIDLRPECEMKICQEKQMSDCRVEVLLKKSEMQPVKEAYKLFYMLTEPDKKEKKNKKTIRKEAIRYYRFLLFVDQVVTKKFIHLLDEVYQEQLNIERDKIRRSLTDEGGTLIVLL